MRSFWKHQVGLFAVALAVGGRGTLAAEAPPTQISAVLAIDFLSQASASIEENADGTTNASVGVFLSPTVFLGVAFAVPSDHAISTEFPPGQSGQGSASGTAHFDLEGVFAFDFVTGMFVGPLDVSVDIAVADPTTVSASLSQGVTAQLDPSTGDTSVVRQYLTGNQASGDTAGSLSISVDDGGGFVTVVNATAVFGMAGLSTVHSVEILHQN